MKPGDFVPHHQEDLEDFATTDGDTSPVVAQVDPWGFQTRNADDVQFAESKT